MPFFSTLKANLCGTIRACQFPCINVLCGYLTLTLCSRAKPQQWPNQLISFSPKEFELLKNFRLQHEKLLNYFFRGETVASLLQALQFVNISVFYENFKVISGTLFAEWMLASKGKRFERPSDLIFTANRAVLLFYDVGQAKWVSKWRHYWASFVIDFIFVAIITIIELFVTFVLLS